MKNIDKILERYFEAETTLEEEQVLREYFEQKNIHERHKIYTPMFSYFVEEKSALKDIKKKNRRKIPHHIWSGIAASIIFLTGVWTIYSSQNKNNEKSVLYINGEKVSDKYLINEQALMSIQNISGIEDDILSTQIDILDSFTE